MRHRNNIKAIRDMALLIIGAFITFGISSYFNMHEKFIKWSQDHEGINIDELLIVCVFLAIGLNIFSLRRWLDLQHEMTRRKKAEKEIKEQLHEKEIILKEIHHRIKNNIYSIRSLLSLHAQGTSNTEAREIINDSINRIESIYKIYEKLLSSDDYRMLSAKDYLEDLVKSIMNVFPEKKDLSVTTEIENILLTLKQLFPLGSIVNELITNSVKHAFKSSVAGNIHISLKRSGDEIILSTQDNGDGFPADLDTNNEKGFGMTLVKLFTRQLQGTFSMENANGARCEVAFTLK